jgi:endonuclease YncB( thermonuclease family)
MGRPYQILLPLLSLFLVRVDLTDLWPLKLRVKVLKVYDGDTVLVSRGSLLWKVRFAKIDAPEKGQPFLTSGGDAGLLAKKCLEKLIQNETETILSIEKEDIYGRILGDINDLSLKLVSAGCTTLYPYAVFDSRKEKMKYLLAFKIAKASKRGLWLYGGFRKPQLWRKFKKRNVGQRKRR